MNMNATAQMVTTTQVGCGKAKPEPASGQWTVDRIYSYGVSDADFGVRLAKDINAALAAERERGERMAGDGSYFLAIRKVREQLNAALAAERDDRISWQELYDKTNDKLAAERDSTARLSEALSAAEHKLAAATGKDRALPYNELETLYRNALKELATERVKATSSTSAPEGSAHS